MIKGQCFGKVDTKLANFGAKIPHFLGKLQKFLPLRARNFEKLHCKGMILEGKFWAERMVVLRSSAPPPGVQDCFLVVFMISFNSDIFELNS